MKKILSLTLSLILLITISTTGFAANKNLDKTKKDALKYSDSTEFYLSLVDEYKVENQNASLDDINKMLKKAMDKYDIYFESENSDDVYSITYSEWLPETKEEMNPQECLLFDSNPYYGLLTLACAKSARVIAAGRYKEYALTDGNGDAFRHTYWNLTMTRCTALWYAEAFANAHERGGTTLACKMDYFNNNMGRNLYVNNENKIESAPSFAQGYVIIDIVQNAIDTGMGRRFSGNDFNGTTLVATDKLGRNQ